MGSGPVGPPRFVLSSDGASVDVHPRHPHVGGMRPRGPMTRRLKRNRIKCRACNTVIESKYTHDFKNCKCGNVFIDGGLSYERFGWPEGGNPDKYLITMFEYYSEDEWAEKVSDE